MTVVHIFKDFYPPTVGGIEQHMHLLCRTLAASVDTVVLVPSRSHDTIDERIDGIRVIRVWTYLAANKGKIRRGLNFI